MFNKAICQSVHRCLRQETGSTTAIGLVFNSMAVAAPPPPLIGEFVSPIDLYYTTVAVHYCCALDARSVDGVWAMNLPSLFFLVASQWRIVNTTVPSHGGSRAARSSILPGNRRKAGCHHNDVTTSSDVSISAMYDHPAAATTRKHRGRLICQYWAHVSFLWTKKTTRKCTLHSNAKRFP